MLKKNSKAYKLDVTAKIQHLREVLHEKEEQVLQQRLLLGRKGGDEQVKLEADAGPPSPPSSPERRGGGREAVGRNLLAQVQHLQGALGDSQVHGCRRMLTYADVC
jgi:hypothetical protein